MKENNSWVINHLLRPVPIYPLVLLRVLFGSGLFLWTIWMMVSGNLVEMFSEPLYFFHYDGLEWLKPIPFPGMVLVFGLMAALALFISAGFYFRISCALFLLGICYFTFIDRAQYLSYYYYLIVLLAMLMVSPAHRVFSFDLLKNPTLRVDYVPLWVIRAFQIQVIMLFYFAGMAKLNADWLLLGQPIGLWLTTFFEVDATNPYFASGAVLPLVLSWLLILFDFIIPPFLFDTRTSGKAIRLLAVVQITAWLFFPTGFFPWLVLFSCSIFVSPWPAHDLISRISYFLNDFYRFPPEVFEKKSELALTYRNKFMIPFILGLFMVLQVGLPVFLFLKWGSQTWEDKAFRFSWDIRLLEKKSTLSFFIVNKESGIKNEVLPENYLNNKQLSRVSSDKELIVKFAEHLQNTACSDCIERPEIYVQSSLSLNGKSPMKLFESDKDVIHQFRTQDSK